MADKAYANAGVDLDLGNRVKSSLGARVKATYSPQVLSKIGGFGGLFDARFSKYKEPVLVSSIDGVGTKLKIALQMGRHNTIGIDLVNHCVNDIAVLGAEPLFFLDYIGTGKLEPDIFNQIIDGFIVGCKQAGCALIGGETAQMPGIYQGRDYDLVGTIIGIVERKEIIDGTHIKPGDVLVGLPSSGLHTNGYSLAREILFVQMRMHLDDQLPENGTKARKKLGDTLLETHVNYQPLLKKLSKKIDIKGLAHITGGGLVDNIPRILPKGTGVEIKLNSWPILPIFELLTSRGAVDETEMYQVFNMGIGMVVITSQKDAEKILKETKAYIIGSVTKGDGTVKLVD